MSKKSSKLYVGMDVHKDSIDLALAEERGEVRHYGRIAGDSTALARTVRKLESLGHPLLFVYEAGPCGFVIHRALTARAHQCWVVAPSNTPRRVSDRIKTDRRDCLKLCGLARAGELTPITSPMPPTRPCAIWCAPAKTPSAFSAKSAIGCPRCCFETTSATSARPPGPAPTSAGSLGSTSPARPSASPSRSMSKA
ncbi:MAG: transposase [Betaproteobacteria bacterium]|nr:transposase [Betaproteobacteria bacterium]